MGAQGKYNRTKLCWENGVLGNERVDFALGRSQNRKEEVGRVYRLGIQEHPTRKRIGKDNGRQGEGERLERRKDGGEDQNSFFVFFFLNSSWMNE